jgi:hypothetical protein
MKVSNVSYGLCIILVLTVTSAGCTTLFTSVKSGDFNVNNTSADIRPTVTVTRPMVSPQSHWISLCGNHACTKVVYETKILDQNGAVLVGPDYRTWTEDIGWDPTMEDVQAAGNAKSCESIGGSYSSSDEMLTVHAGTFVTRKCTVLLTTTWFYKNLVEIKTQVSDPAGNPSQTHELYSYE